MKIEDSELIIAIAHGQQGRVRLLGELDNKVQTYVCALRDAGDSVSSHIVIAAGEGIVTAHDRTLLVSMVSCHKIPASLVINLEQTGLNIVPSGEWTMEKEGSKSVKPGRQAPNNSHFCSYSRWPIPSHAVDIPRKD